VCEATQVPEGVLDQDVTLKQCLNLQMKTIETMTPLNAIAMVQ